MQRFVVNSRSLVLGTVWALALATAGCSTPHTQKAGGSNQVTPNPNMVVVPPTTGQGVVVVVTQQACFKDYSTLQALDSNRKGCGADSDCPTGAYCDPGTVSCRWDCLDSSSRSGV